MPSGQVGVSGYTRRSSTGKEVRVSRYTQKRDLANELNSLGRAPMSGRMGSMAGGRSIPLGKTDNTLKAQQKRVAALRVSVARARAQAAPEVRNAVPSTKKALKESVAGRRAAEQKKNSRAQALADAEKLLQTRGVEPERLKKAQETLQKALQNQKNVASAAEKRKAARAAAEKQRIEAQKAEEKRLAEEYKSAQAAEQERWKREIHPLATGSDAPRDFNYIRNPETSSNAAFQHNFGQDREPAGKYISVFGPQEKVNVPDGWESGTVHFNKPLIIDFGGGYSQPDNWKSLLSDHYDGKTGVSLTEAVRQDGFDAIVTKDKYGFSEVVDISEFKPSSETTLTPMEENTLNEYKAEGWDALYQPLNEWLRKGSITDAQDSQWTPDSVQPHIDNLDSVMSKKTLGAQTLYRGVPSYDVLPNYLESGTIINDKGFVSTSPDLSTARGFGGITLEIQIPDGMPGMDITAHSSMGMDEPEVLLPRNVSFQVIDDYIDTYARRVVQVRAIKPGHEQVPLNASEAEAGKEYALLGYEPVNDYLRGGLSRRMSKEDITSMISSLDAALSKNPLPENTTVYRGVAREVLGLGYDNPLRGEPIAPGTRFKDKAFMSTTTDPDVTESFGSVHLEIEVPKGTGSLDMDYHGLATMHSESEMLLPRGSTLEVISDEGGFHVGRTIKARLLTPDEASQEGTVHAAEPGNIEKQHKIIINPIDDPWASTHSGSTTGQANTPGSASGQADTSGSASGSSTSAGSAVTTGAGPQSGVQGPNDVAAGSGGDNSAQWQEAPVTPDANQPALNPSISAPLPTPKERSAAGRYSRSDYEVNDTLRAGKSPKGTQKGVQEGLDSLFRKSHLSSDMTLYRAATFDIGNVGEVFTDHGFISTEHTPAQSDFANSPLVTTKNGKTLPIGGPKALQMVINVPAGHPAIDMDHAVGHKIGENEILLPRGTSFKIASKERVEGTTHFGYTRVTLDVVPPGTPSDSPLSPAEQARQAALDSLNTTSMESFFAEAQKTSDGVGIMAPNSESFKKISAVYSGNFNGLNSVVDSINTDGGELGDEIEISGRFLSSDGNLAANWTRNFQRNYADDTFDVHHTQIFMNKDFRGQGVVTAWNRAAEDSYRKMGVKRVTMAAVSVGSYAWARAGYDWQRRDDVSLRFVREDTGNEIHKLLDSIEASADTRNANGAYAGDSKFYKNIKSQIDQYREQVYNFQSNDAAQWDDLPTPYDLSQIGFRPGDDRWPGKDGLIGQDWSGEKRLDGPAPDPAHPNLTRTPEVAPPRVIPTVVESPKAPVSPEQAYVDSPHTPDKILTLLKPDASREDRVAFGQQTFDGTFAGLQVSTVHSTFRTNNAGDPTITWGGDIADSSGKKVGDFSRDLRMEDGVLTVNHSFLNLDPEVQGQGFSTAFNAKAEEAYRRMGVQRVTLRANDVGSYAWARAGYDWNESPTGWHSPDMARRELFSNIGNMLVGADSYAKSPEFKAASGLNGPAYEKYKADLALKIRDMQDVSIAYAYGDAAKAELPTPYEISQLGYIDGVQNWPGKQGMLGVQWPAEKRLVPSPATQIAEDRAAGISQSVDNIATNFTAPEAPSPSKYSPNDFFDAISTESVDKANELAKEIWGVKVAGLDISYAKPWYHGEAMRLNGLIKTPEGSIVGSFNRNFSFDGSDLTVEHTSLNIDPSMQGQGIATAFNAQAEKAYRAMGVKKVTLSASYVGAYAWARAGYDWHRDGSKSDKYNRDSASSDMEFNLDRIESAMRRLEREGAFDKASETYLATVQKQIDELRIRADKFAAGEIGWDDVEFPTPYELSQIGWVEGLSQWPGKEGLLNSSWAGEKRLTTQTEGTN